MTRTQPDVNPSGRYTTAEAARLLGVDRHTIMRWRRAGELRARGTNVGRTYFMGIDIIAAFRTH